MKNKDKTPKKISAGIIMVLILSICLGITTFALVYISVSVESNSFHTGTVDINLNDGKPVITEKDFLFEPGMTVKKDFFIESKSSWDVYYKIYFTNVKGELAQVLEVSIQNGDEVLFSGTAAELTRANVKVSDDVLRANERRTLTIYFKFPENTGNQVQNTELSFDICAEAVQTKNNPGKLFD